MNTTAAPLAAGPQLGRKVRRMTPRWSPAARWGFSTGWSFKADTESSFTDWLTANGYPYSTASADVFSYYVAEGLVFRCLPGSARRRRQMAERFAGPWARLPCPSPPGAGRAIAHGKRRQNSSGSGFSWRIFGITHGDVELAFSDGSNSQSGADVLGRHQCRGRPLVLGFGRGWRSPDPVDAFFLPDVGGSGRWPDRSCPSRLPRTENVFVYDDSACSVSRSGRSAHSFVLPLCGLAMVGLVSWRRWRRWR